ncbi:MAG TPA: NUDIX hydrolase [Solirubrobacteraceae bacterium]|nr:NUDIX hydrolase [Solirubrobacteraceae bacterium]
MIRTLSSRVAYENPWMVLREDAIERPGGVQGIYAVVDKPRGALVVPWDGARVHLIGQYRYTVTRDSWEFPQGSVHDGADHAPEHVARTELQEETGLTARTLRPLGSFTFAVGLASQWCDAFLATDLQQGAPRPEPEEVGLRTRAVTVAQLEQELRDGTIFDAATLAAWQLLMLDPGLRAELGR